MYFINGVLSISAELGWSPDMVLVLGLYSFLLSHHFLAWLFRKIDWLLAKSIHWLLSCFKKDR